MSDEPPKPGLPDPDRTPEEHWKEYARTNLAELVPEM